jgi:type IV pilus assembly protein PilA
MKFLKKNGQKGFTLIELLIVVAILGILAAVIIPNVATFMETGRLNAARTEAENIKTAALAYFADNEDWPVTEADLEAPIEYISNAATGTYEFSDNGTIDNATYASFTWVEADQTFIK